MADNSLDEVIRKSISEESVDDILAGIINSDGSFNQEYNGLFARYMGLETPDADTTVSDLSDRTDDVRPAGIQVEYQAEDDTADPAKAAIDEAISKKMGENSGAYESQMSRERSPMFTSGGNVRYPSIGTGASEERVVFDEDWESKAKEESDRQRRYAGRYNPYSDGPQRPERGFVAGGRDLARESYKPVIEQPTSPFVDPISEDADFDRYWAKQYEMSQKKSFFQEGPRANQVKDKTAGAEDRRNSQSSHRNGYYSNPSSGNSSWLEPDTKKKGRRSRKDRSAIPDRTPLPKTVQNKDLTSTEIIEGKSPVAQRTYITKGEREAKKTEQETRDLRNTVAEIVNKYDKKTQEELLARARADKERVEQEKKAAEEEKLKRAAKAKKRMGVSEQVCEALDAEEDVAGTSEVYDDFSEDAEEGFEDIG